MLFYNPEGFGQLPARLLNAKWRIFTRPKPVFIRKKIPLKYPKFKYFPSMPAFSGNLPLPLKQGAFLYCPKTRMV